MDEVELTSSKAWWLPLGALAVLLAAIHAAVFGSTLWPILDHLSHRSIAILAILLFSFVVLLCLASMIAVPLWIAWNTDLRVTASTPSSYLKPIDLTAPREALSAIQQDLLSPKPLFHSTSDAVRSSVDEVFHLIMRDFVQAWHLPLLSGVPQESFPIDTLSSNQFPDMVERTIRLSASQAIERISLLDLPRLGMCKLLPILSQHMKLFERAEVEWKRSGSAAEIAEGEEGDVFLAALYNRGQLHPAVGNIASPGTKMTELAHLRKIADTIIKHTLLEREARSNGVKIVVRELIACTIVKPIVDALSDPDTLNALLEEKAGAALQEQKLVSKLREALDKQGTQGGSTHVSKAAAASSSSSSATARPVKDYKESETSYDSFLDKIGQSKSILEARRTRNGLLHQIRKTKAALGDGENLSETRKRDLNIYLQRLQAAVEAVDHRMQQLGTTSQSSLERRNTPSSMVLDNLADSVSLRDVLSSSSAISHFLEFTESRKRSIFVQFWLSVNTFKNPLEVAESDSEDETRSPSLHFSSSSLQAAKESEVRILNEDLAFFVETYYQSKELAKVVKPKYISTAKEFVQAQTGNHFRATTRSVRLARRSVLRAQKQVYEDMYDEDWPAFQRSREWHRTLEDLQRERAEQAPTVTSSSSFFIEPGNVSEDIPVRPSASRAVSHAHLFGMPESSATAKGAVGLFDEEGDENAMKSRLHSKSSIDQLMGSKGVTFEGVGGRMPLFREALFEDEDANDDMEQTQVTGKEALVQVEKVDAIEDVLAFIIQEGLPPPTVGRKRASSQHSILFGEKEETFQQESPLQSPSILTNDELSLQRGLRHDKSIDPARVDARIERLQHQEKLLAALIRKSELTGSSAKEMRLLERSKTTIARELRELRFEKTTISSPQPRQAKDVQIISSQVRIQITQAELSHDIDGKEYASYLIEVSHLSKPISNKEAKDLVPQSGWVVSRRYNEFYTLHTRLKDKFAQVRALDAVFPGKRFAGMVNAAFLESRRVSLQRYLQEIVKLQVVCNSRELQGFLSQSIPVFSSELLDDDDLQGAISGGEAAPASSNVSSGLVSRFYRGVTGVAEGLDDLLFGPSMYEVIIHRLSTGVVDLVGFNEMERILAGATTSSAAEIKEATQAVTTSSFTGPLCDAIIELFQLKLEGNWFRKQAVIIVAQQALGGTIERKVRQSVAAALEPDTLVTYIAMVKGILWPNGKLKQAEPTRSLEEKRTRRDNALKKLSTLIPNMASHFVGRDNARRAARMSWAILQNKRLNKHIIYTIMDQFLDEIFTHDDAIVSKLPNQSAVQSSTKATTSSRQVGVRV